MRDQANNKYWIMQLALFVQAACSGMLLICPSNRQACLPAGRPHPVRAGAGQGNRAHLVEQALVVEGFAGRAHIGLAECNLLTDIALAVARELAPLVPVRVLGLQAALPLALPSPLLPAGWLPS